jgi:hypothetical protein
LGSTAKRSTTAAKTTACDGGTANPNACDRDWFYAPLKDFNVVIQ